MTVHHSFLDKYAGLNSPVHRRDPRAKIIAFISICLLIISEPKGECTPFIFYFPAILGLILFSRVPPGYIFKRCLIVSPFIILTAIMLPLSNILTPSETGSPDTAASIKAAGSIIFKAFSSIILLTLLTSTDSFHRLLKAMRLLKMPRLLNLLSALMYRYLFIISDEFQRTNLARKSRTPGQLQINRFTVYGHQAALIFIRSWDRSQRVYEAMCSRGFTGDFPLMTDLKLQPHDFIFISILIITFISIRIFL